MKDVDASTWWKQEWNGGWDCKGMSEMKDFENFCMVLDKKA